MSTVILNHRVSDFKSWKEVYNNDKPRRDAAGLKEIALGERSDDPGMVYIIWQTDDISPFNELLQSPELKEKMQEAGVVSQPEVVILN